MDLRRLATDMFNFRTPSVTVQEAYALHQQGAQLIDVRTKNEWKRNRVPGATHISMASLPHRAATLQKRFREQELLILCESGNRSSKATNYLRDLGLSARNVKGGIAAWGKKGLPTEGRA